MGIEVVATAGEVVIVRPGSRHLAWNPTDAPVRLKIEMRPGLRWAEFTRRFFRGDDPMQLLREYSAEVVTAVASVPHGDYRRQRSSCLSG